MLWSLQIEWQVGPLPDENTENYWREEGTEVVMVYFGANANLTNNRGNGEKEPVIMTNKKQEFWTDSNGRQMIRRVQDTRFSYDIGNGAEIEPVTSNYYPINTGKLFEMGNTLYPKIGNFQIRIE